MNWAIVIRVLLSVSGNAVQKQLAGRGMPILFLWLVTYCLILIPFGLLSINMAHRLPPAFWVNSLLGGFLDALGNLAMVAALRSTDLSVFGPLNAFRPVMALLFGWVFLGESPTFYGGCGVVVIVAGAVVLLRRPASGRESGQSAVKPLVYRALGLSLSTIGAVFLKRAAGLAQPEAVLAAWTVCGLLCLMVIGLWRASPRWISLAQLTRSDGWWLVFHAIAFGVMQLITIQIFTETLLAYSFAYFQLGMLLQVIVGTVLFRELGLWRRLAGCLIMGLGACLMTWKG